MRRLNAVRGGYLLMGVGLAVTKWPLLINRAQAVAAVRGSVDLPAGRDGAARPARVAVSGEDAVHPAVRVRLEAALADGRRAPAVDRRRMDPATSEVASNCLWVVIIVAVAPWRYVVARYGLTQADPWRSR